MTERIVIIGGGIAGMGAAHFARLRGLSPIVLEAADSIGGRAGTVEIDGRPYETGGKNFSSDWALFNGILKTFHGPELDRQHPNFHIVIGGKVLGFDKKATIGNGWALARGIGFGGAWRFNSLLREAARDRDRLSYYAPRLAELEAQFDASPLAAQVPPRLADGPLRMFTVIMGAAEPDEFSRATLMLLLSSFGKGSHHSIPETMAALFKRLEQGTDVRTRHAVRKVVTEGGHVVAVEGHNAQGPFCIPADAVIVATPLHRLPRLLELPPDALQAAMSIPYFPLALINADYDADVFTPTMNSIMFDPGSPLGHCSANRMYRRNSVRFTLSGRAARPLLTLDDDATLAAAETAFRKVHPLPGPARRFHVTRHLDGLCGYGFHYSKARRALLGALEKLSGFALAGDYLFGHSMEGCLQSGMAAIEHLSGTSGAYARSYGYPSTGTKEDAVSLGNISLASREPAAVLS